jgi:hypothetical protein
MTMIENLKEEGYIIIELISFNKTIIRTDVSTSVAGCMGGRYGAGDQEEGSRISTNFQLSCLLAWAQIHPTLPGQ